MISSSLRDPLAMMAPALYYGRDLTMDAYGGRRMFKKHKVLPRPDRDRIYAAGAFAYDAWPEGSTRGVSSTGSAQRANGDSLPSSSPPRTPRYQNGPELPPTPPAHSQNSSNSPSAPPSSPTWAVSPAETGLNPPALSSVTPPNQQSPPTPDVTPPYRTTRPRAVRVLQSERTPSKSASDSRSESFITARETPHTSEDDIWRSLGRPTPSSARTSQSTIRRLDNSDRTPTSKHRPNSQARAREPTNSHATPRSKTRPVTFDGEWRMNTGDTEVVREWDDNLQRHVKVRKSRPYPCPGTPSPRDEPGAGIRDDALVSPTNAISAVRAMRLHEEDEKRTSSAGIADPEREIAVSSPAASPTTTDVRRLSGLSAKSAKSTISTVVEAVLIDAVVPQRRRTLRHVKKQTALRDSNSDISPVNSAPALPAIIQTPPSRRPNPPRRPADGRYNSHVSATSLSSLSSSKARKEVWRQGAIPVIVIPDRMSSRKPVEKILRSTSSRRSKRSASQLSAPLSNESASRPPTSTSERFSRHGRSLSEANKSDVRTVDFPPVVPARTSSLSAPTSRNASRTVSRTASLTAESLTAHNAILEAEKLRRALSNVERAESLEDEIARPEPPQQPILQSPESNLQPAAPTANVEGDHVLSLDRHGDPLNGKRMSSRNTPFSLASMDTCGTSHEVAEALAVNIYSHQNTSIVMVDHGSSKPSHDSEIDMSKESHAGEAQITAAEQPQPTITTTAPNDDEPATPPYRQYPGDDVDYSPLRNPRSPPEPPVEPPAIQFIPATPSGATPAHERENLMGNYFDEMEPKPKRSISLVRRALSRRRHSESVTSPNRPRFLTRTLTLSRGIRKVAAPFSADSCNEKAPTDPAYPTEDDVPADEGMLHPFWQPTYSVFGDTDTDSSSSSSSDEDIDYDGQYERVYRYPPVDNRPRRSLSQRLKRTFAVLPLDDDDDMRDSQFYRTGPPGTERRTIGRTASGNLRVMRWRRSLDEGTFTSQQHDDARPYTAPESPAPAPSFWRGDQRGDRRRPGNVEKKVGFLPALGSKIGGLPRRLSERRRVKRSMELRGKISGPREVRDGVGDVIRRRSYRGR